MSRTTSKHGFAAVALLWLIACCGGGGVFSVPLILEPNFEVLSVDSNDSCSTLLDYCVRVSCTIFNSGEGGGTAIVDLQVLDSNSYPILTETERLQLGSYDTKTVTHDFTNASLLGSQSYVNCQIRDQSPLGY